MLALTPFTSDSPVTPFRTLVSSTHIASLLLFAPLSLGVVRVANAQEDSKAQASLHFTRGVELAKAGAYADALIEFQRAYELSPHYSVLYNIGQAYVGLGQPVRAVEALKRYLSEGGAQIALDRRRAVEAEILRQFAQTATVAIDVDVPGASVSVDGDFVGRAPLRAPIRLSIGEHRVTTRLDTGEQREQSITLAAEEDRHLRLELRPVEAPHSANAFVYADCARSNVHVALDEAELGLTPLRAPIQLAAGAHRISFRESTRVPPSARSFSLSPGQTIRIDCGLSAPAPEHVRGRRQATLGYVIGALGIGLGGAAIAHFAWNRGRYDDWKSRFAAYQTKPTAQQRIETDALGASIERASVVTVLLGIGAGVALGTGTLLIVTDTGSGGAAKLDSAALVFSDSL